MPLILLSKVFIYGVLCVSVGLALGTVLFPNIFHAALALAGTLIGIAIFYLAIGADFIALVQILLYIGAVMTLIIFAIMLTQRLGDKSVPPRNRQSIPAFFAVSLFAVILISLILQASWPEAQAAPRVDAMGLGKVLLGVYVFPFEIVSIILLAALIGAVVIARKD